MLEDVSNQRLRTIWEQMLFQQVSTAEESHVRAVNTYHNLGAVRQVEVADAVSPEKFPNLHQTVALFQQLLSRE